MPDVHDLLRSAAGEPLAPLDLDRALQRGAQRTRNRRLTQAAVGSGLVVVAAIAGLSLAGGTPKATPAIPTNQSRLLPDDSVPKPSGSVNPRLQPVPAAHPSELPDGINFVLVKEIKADRTVVVDKVTRTTNVTKQAKCAQASEGYTPAEVFSFCWSNQNAKLRTVPLAAGVTSIPYQPEGDPQTALSLDAFGRLVAGGNAVLRTQVYAVTVRDNTIESFTLAGNV